VDELIYFTSSRHVSRRTSSSYPKQQRKGTRTLNQNKPRRRRRRSSLAAVPSTINALRTYLMHLSFFVFVCVAALSRKRIYPPTPIFFFLLLLFLGRIKKKILLTRVHTQAKRWRRDLFFVCVCALLRLPIKKKIYLGRFDDDDDDIIWRWNRELRS
jgi:hypothetical protein